MLFTIDNSRQVGDIACCKGGNVSSCQQINVETSTLGDDILYLPALNETVKFKSLVGTSGNSYLYGNDKFNLYLTKSPTKNIIIGHTTEFLAKDGSF